MKYVLFVLWVLCVPSHALEKWLYHSTNLLVDKNIDSLETLWRRASAGGYTHVLLADSKFGRLNEMDPRYFKNIERVKKMDHIKSKDLARWLSYVGMTEDEFDRIADTFRDPRVWRRVRGEWVKANLWD